jgi:hypothetical protein
MSVPALLWPLPQPILLLGFPAQHTVGDPIQQPVAYTLLLWIYHRGFNACCHRRLHPVSNNSAPVPESAGGHDGVTGQRLDEGNSCRLY